MHFNRTTDYMVRCVLYLAQCGTDRVVSRQAMVEATGIPDAYFRKIMSQLGRQGIVTITRGARGGYRLTATPSQLTLLDVVEAGVGEIRVNECVAGPKVCDRSAQCPVHPVWRRICETFRQSLRDVTFGDLLASSADGAWVSTSVLGKE